MIDEHSQAVVVRGTEILPNDARQRYREKIARITLDSLVQFVGLLDRDGKVLDINQATLDAAGITLEDVEGQPIGSTFWWQVSAEINAGLREAIAQASRGEFVRWDAEIFSRADGKETIRLDASLRPVLDEEGQVVFLCIEGRDISEKTARERELTGQNVTSSRNQHFHSAQEELERVTAESERRKWLYETILSATPDFVYVFSLDYHILYANDSLVSMWGIGDPVGKTFLEIGYEPWHAEMHSREIDTVRSTKKPIRGEVPFSGTDGRKIYDYIFVPVFGLDGEVEAVAGTTRDVSERKAMEEELRNTDRRKDDFIALLAHELRNPLAPIRNGLQVLRLAEGDPRAIGEARAMMDRQLSHMVRLIDDLLDVSRINRNKMELRRARVTLADVVASAVETAQPQISQANHELLLTLPATPIHLDADLTRLAQVFSNLLTNSAKYTEPGGRISLSAERIGGQVEVAIRDNGIGIPAASLTNIFDMFSQVDRTIERSTGGLGIGLALVRGLVEMHGGSVTAASEGEGQGSTFTVTLPVLAERTATVQPDVFNVAQKPVSRRILVVDDNRDGADSLAMMLRLMGNEVRTANDGIEAIELAEQFHPDVVLMDVGMPRLDGLEATRRIRGQAWSQGMTIVALTGWGQEHGHRMKIASND